MLRASGARASRSASFLARAASSTAYRRIRVVDRERRVAFGGLGIRLGLVEIDLLFPAIDLLSDVGDGLVPSFLQVVPPFGDLPCLRRPTRGAPEPEPPPMSVPPRRPPQDRPWPVLGGRGAVFRFLCPSRQPGELVGKSPLNPFEGCPPHRSSAVDDREAENPSPPRPYSGVRTRAKEL
jgi:hypothetical protein